MTFGVSGALLASPILAASAIAVGVPILLIGTYVVIPAYLMNEHAKFQKLKEGKKQLVLKIDEQEAMATEEVAI